MTKIIIKNARLSYPALFEKSVFKGKVGKYQATLLIDKKDEALKKQIDENISKAISEYKNKIKISPENYCIKDGDNSGKEEYKGYWSLKASQSKRPVVFDRDKAVLTAEDDKIYSGCYVNAVIDFWIQDNEYGKRVNANLYGVQFAKDGERFGMGSVDVEQEFEDLDEL